MRAGRSNPQSWRSREPDRSRASHIQCVWRCEVLTPVTNSDCLKLRSRDNVMWKAMVSIMVVLGTMSVAGAQTITDPNEIASRLHFWAQETGDPVYYGEVRSVNARSRQILGHYRCLALAFIKYEGGVFYYAHKMWGKSSDGSCHYDDVTSRKVDNHGVCVKDTDAGFGSSYRYGSHDEGQHRLHAQCLQNDRYEYSPRWRDSGMRTAQGCRSWSLLDQD